MSRAGLRVGLGHPADRHGGRDLEGQIGARVHALLPGPGPGPNVQQPWRQQAWPRAGGGLSSLDSGCLDSQPPIHR